MDTFGVILVLLGIVLLVCVILYIAFIMSTVFGFIVASLLLIGIGNAIIKE